MTDKTNLHIHPGQRLRADLVHDAKACAARWARVREKIEALVRNNGIELDAEGAYVFRDEVLALLDAEGGTVKEGGA